MRRVLMILILCAVFLPLAPAAGQDGSFIQHRVVPGDTLFRISLRYGVPIASILAANPGIHNPNLIYAGSVLRIPQPGTAPVPSPQPPPTQEPAEEQQYRVVRGDTLGAIARRFGTTVTAIAQRNNIVNPNLIFPGQLLFIPVPGAPPPAQPPTQPPPPTSPPPPSGDGGPVTTGFELGGQVFSFQYDTLMRQAGMTWVKRQVVWNLGDSTSVAQGYINEARNKGFKILLSIKGNPAQIAANPAQYYQQFAAFLGDVAALGPEAIEVWNEQNIDREWPAGQISPQAYTQMLTAAYNAIKSRNSSVMVISGAPAPTGFFGGACTAAGCDDQPFLVGMRNAGAANVMDCVGIHYNEGVLSPDARSGDPRGNPNHYTRYYGTMVDTYRAAFPDKPLCFTELGYLSPEGYGPLPDAFAWAVDVTVQDQAAWLARAATLARQSGFVRLLIVWNVDATEYGQDPQAGYAIIRPNNTCLACNTLAAVMD
ncbi:MAG TPA: LysM domain-containing protein [Spirillospora sp.]|nr:LysM domain-containing protein [Spirillospora sp.]